MAGIQLKVAPDVMKSKAQEITGQIDNISKSWQELCNLISKSKGYWEGEASDYHRKTFDDNKTDAEELLKRLKEHPKELLTMAGIYEQAETEAQELASSLPEDIIV